MNFVKHNFSIAFSMLKAPAKTLGENRSETMLRAFACIAGGKGTIKDTFKIIAYGDALGLLFGWVPYFATIAACMHCGLQWCNCLWVR